MTPEERATFFKVQSNIFEHFRDLKLYKVTITHEGLEFESKGSNKREAIDDIILQVFMHIDATKKLVSTIGTSDESKEKKIPANYNEKFLLGPSLVTTTPEPNAFTLYNFFERCRILLTRINTFDNLALE